MVKGLQDFRELTIDGEQQDLAKLDDLGINTDADNIITITKDESWEESFKVDLINVGVAAEQVDNLVNVVESFTAKVPDHVLAQGKAAEDIYRKAIANGMEKDNLKAFANSPEFAQVASLRARIEQEYENGTATAEYIYTQLHNEVLAFANDYVVQNCSSGTAICDSILRAMGTSSEDLSSGAIVDLMLAIEGLYKSGGDGFALEGVVDATGAQIIGDSLMQVAIDCSIQWIKDTREKNGDLAADEQVKQNIQDPKYKEFLERSGVEPVDYLVATEFDIDLERDPTTHDKVKNIMQIKNQTQQVDELVKMLVKLDSNGKPIVKNGKYVADDEKNKDLLRSMLYLVDTKQMDAATWESLSLALYLADQDKKDYPEASIIKDIVDGGGYHVPMADEVNGNVDLSVFDGDLYGETLFDTEVSWDRIRGAQGVAYSNSLKYQTPIYEDGDGYILGDFTPQPGSVSNEIKVSDAWKNSSNPQQKYAAYYVLAHEKLHVEQYDNIYKLINYGRDGDGNLVADDCLDTASCRGTLWQYVNKKRKQNSNYTTKTITVNTPTGGRPAYSPYRLSPLEYWPQKVHGSTNPLPVIVVPRSR